MSGGKPLEQGSALPGALARLEQVLDDEIAALKMHDHSDLAGLAERKSRCLLELTSRRRQPDREDRERIVRVREKLELGQRLLGAHLRASQDVAELLARIATAAEGDGTYGRVVARGVATT